MVQSRSERAGRPATPAQAVGMGAARRGPRNGMLLTSAWGVWFPAWALAMQGSASAAGDTAGAAPGLPAGLLGPDVAVPLPLLLLLGGLVTAGLIVGAYRLRTALRPAAAPPPPAPWEGVFQAIAQPAMVLSPDLRVMAANRATLAALGRTAEQVTGRLCHELVHGTTEPPPGCPMSRLLKSGQAETVAMEIEAVGGHSLVSCTPICDAQGRLERVVHIATNITDRRRAEDELRREQARVRTLVDLADVILLMLDSQGRVVSLNAKGCAVLSCAETDLLGVDWFERCVPARLRSEQRAAFEAALDGRLEGTRVAESPVLTRLGDERLILWHTRPLTDDQRQITGMLSSGDDITDQRRADEGRRLLENRVRQIQKLESLGVMAGGVAHDFNNLLMGIMGNADLALRELPPDLPVVDYLRDIEAASRRAAAICRQLLAYSGKGRFQVEHLDLSELVRDMQPMLSASVTKRATLHLRLAPDLPRVEADASQIRQIVVNLVTNAAEALDGNSGEVTLATGAMQCDGSVLRSVHLEEARPGGTYVLLDVTDTGCGMPPDVQARMFDPFFSTKFTGRGLGLSAVLGIVRGHHGAISVWSEPGRGARIRVLLPAAPLPAANGPGSTDWVGSGTVLLVDAEEGARTATRQMLGRVGFRVLAAAHAADAVSLSRDRAEELVCVILGLPLTGMGGEAAYDALQSLRPGVPVIVASPLDEQEARRRFAGAPLAGYLHKPYEVAAVMAELRSVLAAAGQVRSVPV